MPRNDIFTNGVRTAVEDWNDTTRQVTVYAGDGVTVTSPARAYSSVENAAADLRVATTTYTTNKSTTQANLLSDMTLLQTQIAKTNAVLTSEFTNNNIGAMLKDIYRTQRRLVRIALDRFADGSD